mmetsp:Transcript_129894/g.416834  ORF Transcript_129894/g.416834 Transcript_129894/m.416834 type:complete len:237 (+) Transcript_129894:57-767(+)
MPGSQCPACARTCTPTTHREAHRAIPSSSLRNLQYRRGIRSGVAKVLVDKQFPSSKRDRVLVDALAPIHASAAIVISNVPSVRQPIGESILEIYRLPVFLLAEMQFAILNHSEIDAIDLLCASPRHFEGLHRRRPGKGQIPSKVQLVQLLSWLAAQPPSAGPQLHAQMAHLREFDVQIGLLLRYGLLLVLELPPLHAHMLPLLLHGLQLSLDRTLPLLYLVLGYLHGLLQASLHVQ